MRVMGFVGSSGSGKTTLIANLLPVLTQLGLRVSTAKHAHHGFDMDRPGKDSYRHREAGAEEVMVVSNGRWALLREQRDYEDVSLQALLRRMTQVDLVLVEGFHRAAMPKIEVYRPSLQKAPLFPNESGIVAVASDALVETGELPLLSLTHMAPMADFVLSCAENLS
ncbi:MAG: molybdopterin-guanine dinucleotide biosynthesis protein B [Alphaproteobacteria bacterium]|nr:molybdopterin-guanine dinucleotide biosynthesis protein B [Alphaproteobacteria bacterium]MDE2112983.1 molybdopterin-guanine dinucleotide biosynthesis protein B [Alphaproteobacteria bacterium]MDE2492318.1 molybdopterin-guanine dinucleotide biosynthesis protein B [Alphaproteobacteria bacterium]